MKHCYEYAHPAVTTDVVVFTIEEDRLKLLLIRRGGEPFKGSWALPGGFLDIEEDIDTCAKRELREETGLTDVFLEQLYSFGRPDRDPRERIISIAYFALVPFDRHEPVASSDAVDASWFDIDNLPELAFDHDEIIATARNRLVAKLDYSTIGFRLLPEVFTLSEVQHVYEVLLNRGLDKRNFRKRITALGLLEETGQLRRNGQSRPAREYRWKHPDQIEFIK